MPSAVSTYHNSLSPASKTGLNAIDPNVRIRIAKAKAQALKLKYSYDTKPADNQAQYVAEIQKEISQQKKHSKVSITKIANQLGIIDPNIIKELTELAICNEARKISLSAAPLKERYDRIVDLYNHQANLSHRTSQSIMLQQYSTPAPISFIAGIYAKGEFKNPKAFEPSAGNGLLTIAFNPSTVIVNEIDEVRRTNLETTAYKEIRGQDATYPFTDLYHSMDSVVSNPPFGTTDVGVDFDGYKINTLDHIMALRALQTLKDSGRAAIIIGGHMSYDAQGRIQAGKNRIFFNYLYSHYLVDDIININSKKLYTRQGTGFDVRLILIAGRKNEVSGAAPLLNKSLNAPVNTFEELYDRVMLSYSNLSGLYSPQYYSSRA